MDTAKRVAYFRDQVAECERGVAAQSNSDKRASLIAARGGKNMAEREVLKYVDVPATTLISAGEGLEDALAKLAAKNGRA